MPSLTHRAYAGAADLAAVLELWLAARAVDRGDLWPPLDTLQGELLACPQGTPYTGLWEDQHGVLVGVAMLLDESVLLSCTRVGADDERLASAMLSWGLASAGRAARGAGECASLFVPVCSDDRRLAALLERTGFQEDAWQTLRMERALHTPIDAPSPPQAVLIRPFVASRDLAAATALHGRLFVGGRKSVNERCALMDAPGYRPELDLVAVLADGTLAGYALAICCELERQRLGQRLCWLEFVGVDQGYRKRGLGRALTLELLQAMRAAGLDTVRLSTGAANLAARRLFEDCGFQVRQRIRWYVREAERPALAGLPHAWSEGALSA